MFERYTEDARRVLFFAHYEATQLGSLAINAEHLLLGLVRFGGHGAFGRCMASVHINLEDVRQEVFAAD